MFPTSWPLNPAGGYHLAFFGLLLPFLSWRGRRKVANKAAPPVNRLAHLRATTMMMLLYATLSLWVAHMQGIQPFTLVTPPLLALGAAVAFYAAAVAFMRPRWRRAVERRARIVHLYMPSNATERAWWIAVSVLAGIGEEITWRGVQTPLLTQALGNAWLAALVCAAMFGAAHFVQGWRSALIITVFALGFQALVWLSGSLYVAMLVHVVYDITAGFTYGKLGRELGYSLEPAPAAAPD